MCRAVITAPKKNETTADNKMSSTPALPATLTGIGWKARGDRRPKERRVPFNRPTPRQVFDALPFVRRYFLYWVRHVHKKEKLFINTFEPLQHKPYYGVPCGGIGAGSIGRDFRGGFCKFGLRPGLIEHKIDVIPADQFILSIREPGSTTPIFQKVLCAATIERANGQLTAWDFTFKQEDLHYRGLYPRSWTEYKVPSCNLSVTLRQVNPVFPNNYKETSFPTTAFIFDVDNKSNVEYEVSIAFVFRNGTGKRRSDLAADCTAENFEENNIAGVSLQHKIDKMNCTYGLATRVKSDQITSLCRSFDPCGNGLTLWQHLAETGNLPGEADLPYPARLGVGVCVKGVVPPKSTRSDWAEFSLAWDMPKVKFGDGRREYKRRYTRFFDSLEGLAAKLCTATLLDYSKWETKINEWQEPLLRHSYLPEWYKAALFNELYYMTDGGSMWFEYDENWSREEPHLSPYTQALMKRHGRFGYLESWEYRMVTTYDVHFYASYAIASLWPDLELTIQAEFTDQVGHSAEKEIRFHMEGDKAPLKSRARVPHDLGNPAQDPWLLTNAYVMHDTGKWKDLNLKFVLTSWRDYVILTEKNRKFLDHVYPAVKLLINDALDCWDQDRDGMIENFGKADQTYDAWQMEGVSAYCGSLWLGALRVAEAMAEECGDIESSIRYHQTLVKAKQVFIDKLWNGAYFNFCERSKSRDSVMADQLCGIWFLQSCSPEMAAELVPTEKVSKALATIYELNVCKFGDGKMGAVNGMRPDGTLDRAYIQADEMWTGVTYAVAAFMIQQGELQRGFDTAFGSYDSCFERFGLQFQTPEAIYEKKYYRAIGYMRPLSIWAMQWALERFYKLGKIDEHTSIQGIQRTTLAVPSPCPSSNNRSLVDSQSEGYCSEERDESNRESNQVLTDSGLSTSSGRAEI
ncbi:unnamed protein product, partial [Mesorhabditis belari]|uniref:Non-lysosomal glucosylceramidase n=1 Tax=Mesorhabditis belari TaxID=2138241 RepID=A0AAF3F3X0_9BILA